MHQPDRKYSGSCTGGYAKPSWQVGTGVPNDDKRDIPDVSLFASNGFMGNFYVICQSDSNPYGTCNTSSDSYFLWIRRNIGLVACLRRNYGVGQPADRRAPGQCQLCFLQLAAQIRVDLQLQHGPASTCIFNDVTSGTIAMPCATGSPNCTTTIAGDAFGVLSGYSAGTGYDLATGLGSVNVDQSGYEVEFCLASGFHNHGEQSCTPA